jgi:uncharacterized protein (DUF952 family)
MDIPAGIGGFAVEGVNGSLGRVAEVRGGAGGAFLVVRRPSGREQLLPVGVIEGIDVAEKRVCVYRSTREVDAAPSDEAGVVRHYGPWGAGHRVLPAERSRQLIAHIAERAEWETATARAEYRPASLADSDFVHASTAYSVLLPANLFYRGRPGLVLLAIDQQRLRSEIRWEEPQPTVEAFPHIYGPVNVDAVVAVEPFDPGPDGSFELPLPIRELADAYAARA